MTIRVRKSTIVLSFLFVFTLGVQAGVVLRFIESDNQFRQNLRNLEESATWEP